MLGFVVQPAKITLNFDPASLLPRFLTYVCLIIMPSVPSFKFVMKMVNRTG